MTQKAAYKLGQKHAEPSSGVIQTMERENFLTEGEYLSYRDGYDGFRFHARTSNGIQWQRK